jgi:VWFA-related protein
VLVSCAAGASAVPERPPVFSAEIGVVVLQATVHNRRGEVVAGLPRQAFTVYENGDRQDITIFRHGDVPVSLGILLDNSRSMRGRRETAESAALAALRASRPQDEAFVMNFADKAQVDVPLTSDLAALAAGIARRDSIGGTALRDAVAQAADYLVENAARSRRVLLVVSDGNDNASLTAADAVRRTAVDHDIAVYAIGIASPDQRDAARRGRDALEELTESTGGVTRQAWSGIEADAHGREAALQMRHFYTIGYAPLDQALDGTYRKLRVVAKGQEPLRVKARAGYRATRPAVRRPGG